MWVLRICTDSVAVASRELWAELGLVHCRYKERTPAAGWAPAESCRLMRTHPNPFHFKKTAGVCKCRWPRVTPNHSGSKVNLELSAGLLIERWRSLFSSGCQIGCSLNIKQNNCLMWPAALEASASTAQTWFLLHHITIDSAEEIITAMKRAKMLINCSAWQK